MNTVIQVNPLLLLEVSLSHRQPLTECIVSYTFISGLTRNPIQNDQMGPKWHTQWRHTKQDRLKRYWTPRLQLEPYPWPGMCQFDSALTCQEGLLFVNEDERNHSQATSKLLGFLV